MVMRWGIALIAGMGSFALLVGFGWGAYYLLTLPLRRQERAWLFLQILEAAINRGISVEQAFTDVTRPPPKRGWRFWVWLLIACYLFGAGFVWLALRPRELGWGFSSFSRKLRKGYGLVRALRWTPGFVPRQIIETLAVGERIGDLRLVLPACRQVVSDARSRVRAAMNFFILIVCQGVFIFPPILLLMWAFIAPQFVKMFTEMNVTMPHIFFAVTSPPVLWTATAAGLFLVLCPVWYSLGLMLKAFAPVRYPADLIATWLPWRIKRLHRDFSFALATLLDAGVPEPGAVTLAAESTGNWVLIARGKSMLKALGRGIPLTVAIRLMDRSGELRWRLDNAVHGGLGFARALAGWHQALEAKAEQQEQAAAQLITTGLLLCNGVIVGVFAVAVFQALIGLQRGLLW